MARVRKNSGIVGKIVAILIGFLIGIVSTVGGIVGAGYYIVANVPVKDGFNAYNGATGSNVDYTEYITEYTAQSTILSLFGDIQTFSEEANAGTASFGSLEKFSPKIRELAETLSTNLAIFGVPVDVDEFLSTPFSGLETYVNKTIDNTEVGKAAGSYAGTTSKMLMLICYGEENFEYIWEDLDGDGNNDVKMLANNKPTLVGDLKTDDGFNKLLGRVSLAAFLKASGGADEEDVVVRAFLYGVENKDYILIDQDGDGQKDDVQMLSRYYAFNETLNAFADDDENVYTYDSASGTWVNQTKGYAITTGEGEYAYKVINADGETVEDLKTNTLIPGAYEVYRSGVQQKRRGLTLGHLMGEGVSLTDVLYEIELGDMMGLDGSSDSMMLSIAYGEEDIDYTVDPTTNEIIPITAPTKVGDLMEIEQLKEKVNQLKLSNLLDISPLDQYTGKGTPDSMLLLLAYGEEGVHYELADDDQDGTPDTIRWLTDSNGNPYNERTIKDLTSEGENVFDDISIASVLNVTADSDALLINLAYGPSNRYDIDYSVGTITMKPIACNVVDGVAYDDVNDPFDTTLIETVDGDTIYWVSNWHSSYYIRGNGNTYYAYATLENAQGGLEENRLKYTKHMLSALRGSEANLLLEDIELGAALGVTPTSNDPLLVALAYGYDGTQFTVNGDEITWNVNPETGLFYRPRTLKDLQDAQSLIRSLKLADIIGDVTQSENPLLYAIKEKGWTIQDMTQDNLMTLKISDVLTVDSTSPVVLQSMVAKGWTLSNLTEQGKFETLTLEEVITVSPTDTVIYALRTSQIKDLESSIRNLTLYNVLGDDVEANRFLKLLADVPIDGLKDAMNSLTIVEVFEDKVYLTATSNGETYYVDANNNRLYYNSADGKYYKDAALTTEGTRAMDGVWAFMLDDPTDATAPEAYTVDHIDEMIDNVKANMQTATLYELVDSGLLVLTNVNLDATSLYNGMVPLSKALGAHTLDELVYLLAPAT